MQEYLSALVGKLTGASAYTWAAIALLTAFAAVLAAVGKKIRFDAKMIATGALCVAIAVVLSLIRLYRFPQGGSVTLASMLPIFVFSWTYGILPGMLCGASFGLVGLLTDPYVLHPLQFIFDYPLPYMALGLAGAFLGANLPFKVKICAGIGFGAFARFLIHVLSGVFFFASYAPEGQNPLVYSIGYNGTYMLADTAVCIAAACIPAFEKLLRAMTGRLRV